MARYACGACEGHNTATLNAERDDGELSEIWSELERTPARYKRPDDGRIDDLWKCYDCGAYTWQEFGAQGERRGRFTWRRGTATVSRVRVYNIQRPD